MSLNNFLSNLPIDKIIKTEILDNKIQVPANIEPSKFYRDFSQEIKSPTLTVEKALFVCATLEREKFKNFRELLNSNLKFS